MVIINSTATIADVRALVDTGMIDSEIETLLDGTVYNLIQTFIGGSSIGSGVKAGVQTILAAYLIRKRDPSKARMLGSTLEFRSMDEFKVWVYDIIISARDKDDVFRTVGGDRGKFGYNYRLSNDASRSPPF